MQQSRREFLKTSCTACLGALVLGFTLESCKSNALYKTTVLHKKI